MNNSQYVIDYVVGSRYDEIPALPDAPDRHYVIPPSPAAKLDYRGLPLDELEDLLANSPAWRQAKRITHAPKPEFAGRTTTCSSCKQSLVVPASEQTMTHAPQMSDTTWTIRFAGAGSSR